MKKIPTLDGSNKLLSKFLKFGVGAGEVAAGDDARFTAAATHAGRTDNPHGVSKAQVGLGNVDNTSDAGKPVSTAQAAAIAAGDATAVPKSLVDAKGDLLVGTGDNTLARLAAGANGRFLLPDSTQTSGWRFSSTAMFEGTGSPEGVITAGIGSVFINTEAGGWNGARRWEKRSGAGNIGWVVTSGDTGSRDVVSLLSATWAKMFDGSRIRRAGPQVTLNLRLQRVSAGGNRAGWTAVFADGVPGGFRPEVAYATLGNAVLIKQAGGVERSVVFNGNTASSLDTAYFANEAWSAGDVLIAACSFTTGDPWPTALPG